MRTPMNTLPMKRVRGVRLPSASDISTTPSDQTFGAFGAGGSAWPGVERWRPLAGEIAGTTPDTVESVLRGQAPTDPIEEMSLMSPMFNVNGYNHIARTPTSFSVPGLDTFDIGTAFFIRKPKTGHTRTSVWDNTAKKARTLGYGRQTQLQQRGRAKVGEDTMMSICALNALLYRTQLKKKLILPNPDEGTVGNAEEHFKQHSLDPKDVEAQWAFDGFVVSQMHGANHRGRVYDRSLGKMLIIAAAEMTYKVFNLWGNEVKESNQLLFFIIKGVDLRTPRYRHNPDARDPDVPQVPAGSKDDYDFVDNPVQIVPWTDNRKRWPTMDDLRYIDDFGRTKYGVAIPVGTVRMVPPTDDMSFARDAWRDASAMVGLPSITIMQNPHLALIDKF
jgi:hypothetical protein